jgi:hypothetical protein
MKEESSYEQITQPDSGSPSTPVAGSTRPHHNNRDGTFSATTTLPSQTKADAWYAGVAADFDNDGKLDLFVARENKPGFFYFNNGDGTFTASQSRAGTHCCTTTVTAHSSQSRWAAS